ncbi:YcgN family cysteine cluster protein [Pleionea sediminis]|uniref:YcgN family cysteine cluster protein n=1 Tax=Pleionea sediminis TaxID=2569479 RepID=UPI001186C11D|nr:YcgN family cysteine cluster protein [Pleionea sediminis]
MTDQPFWQTTALEDMTDEQWESLCDGCGKCCAYKVEGDEGEYYQTDVCCRFFDAQTCQCTQYKNRSTLVPDCIQVTPQAARQYAWLPNTCAYKLLAQGRDLPEWHPLVTGDPESVHKANRSARGKVISENQAGDLEDHVIAILIPDDPDSDPLSDFEADS